MAVTGDDAAAAAGDVVAGFDADAENANAVVRESVHTEKPSRVGLLMVGWTGVASDELGLVVAFAVAVGAAVVAAAGATRR